MTTTAKKRGRPPKNTSTHRDTRQILIRAGVELLTEQGFTSSGLDSILKRAGIPKGSFYYYFSNKETFGIELLNSYSEFFLHKLRKHLLDESLEPMDRIVTFAEDAKSGMAKYQFNRGCLVGNLSQEVTTLPESYREILKEIFKQWQQEVAHCLALAQKNQQLDTQHNCYELAEFFWIGWEGAVLRAGIEQNAEPLDKFIKYFMAGLKKT